MEVYSAQRVGVGGSTEELTGQGDGWTLTHRIVRDRHQGSREVHT